MIGTVSKLRAWLLAHKFDLTGLEPPSEGEENAVLTLELDAASSRLAGLCQRQLEPQEDYVEHVEGTGTPTLLLSPSEFQEIDAVAYVGSLGNTAVDAARYLPLGNDGLILRLQHLTNNWTYGATIAVTGTRGLYADPTAPPADLELSAYVLVAQSLFGGAPNVQSINVLGVQMSFDPQQFEKGLLRLLAKRVKRV